MAATTSILQFRTASGRPINASVYNASSGAIGTWLPINFTGVAAATDPSDFSFQEDTVLEEVMAIGGAPATGEVQLIKAGQPTNAVFAYAANSTALAKRQTLGWRLQAGVSYRLRVFNTLAA